MPDQNTPSFTFARLDQLLSLPLESVPDGGCRVNFAAQPGLYQLSIIADASGFDWESLYFDLHLFENKGQRTGPWDFDFRDGNRPLVPAYWVSLDGRPIGLWFFQRVSVEDIAGKRFRGRMAFHLPEEGQHVLEFTPYRPLPISWISCHLEVDPEDRLMQGPLPLSKEARMPASCWGDSCYTAGLRESLGNPHNRYAKPMHVALEWVLGRTTNSALTDLELLVAAWRLVDSGDAHNRALALVEEMVAKPHWGNPQEDGYSHNGDMGATLTMRALAFAWHALGDEMHNARKEALRAKLTLQGNRFFELAFLNRDYWGGSLVQDHGWRSHFAFGAAALNLLGVVPEAERWIAFVLPRARRALDAMPRDGAIPPSSYGCPFLYLYDLTTYREALVARGQDDIFDEPPFRAIIDYLGAVILQDRALMIAGGSDVHEVTGANAFLNAMTEKYGDTWAEKLEQMILTHTEIPTSFPRRAPAWSMGVLAGFLSAKPSTNSSRQSENRSQPTPPPLHYFPDSGMAHYRNDREGVVLSLRCGPWCGTHTYASSACPSDRMDGVPGAGHFILYLNGQPRLGTPDTGYRLHSFMRSCLLIDDCGQHDDVGYPMSIPSKLYRGERIESVQWQDASDSTRQHASGSIRLDLKPAYPDALGVAFYTRELLFSSPFTIICRDRIVLGSPRRLSWLFHAKRKIGLSCGQDLTATFGHDLTLQARAPMVPLHHSIAETDVVWSYVSANGREPFDHVRYDTQQPVQQAEVDFTFRWSG